uniref:Uncharacterized protein n=1 Tax=Conchiformibius kuhniae TaxID=211502 RepID=A0A8T9MW67_9NEIS|nr:hypothetical protein LVJ77_10775 [Conchiformibius kuhniae]
MGFHFVSTQATLAAALKILARCPTLQGLLLAKPLRKATDDMPENNAANRFVLFAAHHRSDGMP